MPGDKRTVRSYAKELRRKQTDAERVLWMRLRARQILGLKFRRQHPIGGYIVDFCCPEAGLVVELDGSQHVSQASADQYWTEFLLQEGHQVLRYWNHEVLTVPDAVLQHIANTVSDPHPHPLPERARVRKNKKRPER